MAIETVEEKKESKLDLPLLMKAKTDGEVVLVTEQHEKNGIPVFKGVVVKKGDREGYSFGETNGIGYYSDHWRVKVFEPCKEEITLKNKDSDAN